MTIEQTQNDLRTALGHFIGLGRVMKESVTSFYPTERGVLVYAMLVAGRRLGALMKAAAEWQKRFIINITGIDLVNARIELLGTIEYLKQCDCDLEISMPREDNEPLFDSERIVERENYTLLFPSKENDSEYVRARRLMIEASPKHFEELEAIVKDVNDRIDNMLTDEKNVRHDKDIRIARLREMKSYYRENLWNQAKGLLVNRAKGELSDNENSGKTEIEILQSLLSYIVTSNTIGNIKNELAYINQQRGDEERLAAAFVEKRDKLSFDDAMQHCEFVASESLLIQSIEAKRLREPCEEYEGKLFKTKAALEFTTLIKPTIKRKVDFNRKINIALFFAALKDFGLVYADERNATLMAQYIGEVYDEVVSSDSISRIKQKCLGKSFCCFDDTNHGNFSDKEFAKYKEAYSYCNTIIRGITLIDIEHSADYIKEAYNKMRLTELYEGLDDDHIDRLSFAGFVLRGGNLGF